MAGELLEVATPVPGDMLGVGVRGGPQGVVLGEVCGVADAPTHSHHGPAAHIAAFLLPGRHASCKSMPGLRLSEQVWAIWIIEHLLVVSRVHAQQLTRTA